MGSTIQSANAQGRRSTRAAQKQTEQGFQAYQRGDYQSAINFFWAAYEIRPAPQILFNIAQAHRKLDQHQLALELYERFLREDPKTPLRTEAETNISEMQARLAEKKRSEEAKIVTLRAAEPPPAAPPTPVYKKAWFWGVLGGVVAAGAAAAVVGVVVARRDPSTDLGIRIVEF